MPMCPNCGSWVSEGSSTWSCGTPMGGYSYVDWELEDKKRDIKNLYYEVERLKEKGRLAETLEKYEEIRQIDDSDIPNDERSNGRVLHILSNLDIDIADLHFELGEYEKALELYSSNRSFSYENRRKAAQCMIKLEIYDDAIDELKELIEHIKGVHIMSFDDWYSNDEKDYERYVRVQKSWYRLLARLLNELGEAYFRDGRPYEAISCYEDGIGFDHDYARNWCCKAFVLERLKRYVEALKFYGIALAIDEDDEFTLKNRKSCLESYATAYVTGNYDVKSEYLKEALKLIEDEEESMPIIWGYSGDY
ncbi:tetratricopeptide repeat protein [Methanobrevibacter sp.]|uniref:tetratricopeptide repeat protein n=1 Tax=Methanobrevibacter sp. TaxID=66852 RepID=UPI0025EEB5A6|nr:tetratricopeptide repeat protein [Methanobrevibacter sp.]